MERTYWMLRFETWAVHGDIERAVAEKDCLLKTYLLNDESVGRVDTFVGGELDRVSYRQLEPPHGEALGWHYRRHPGVACDIWTPERAGAESLRVVRVRYHDASGVLIDEKELHFTDPDRPLREVRIGADGGCEQEATMTYDDRGECVRVTVRDGAGTFLYETDPRK